MLVYFYQYDRNIGKVVTRYQFKKRVPIWRSNTTLSLNFGSLD